MMKLHKSGFLPNNGTKLGRLFFAIKTLFMLFLLLFSINSLIKFIPLANSAMLVIGLTLFLSLTVTKVLQGICVYQNVYENYCEHKYTKIQKIFIYMTYTISLLILPLSFVFLVLQYNSVINIEKLKILNQAMALFFISSIVLFCMVEGIFSSKAPELIKKIKYIEYGKEDIEIKWSKPELKTQIEENKKKRDELVQFIKSKIEKIDSHDRHLGQPQYVRLIEQLKSIKNSRGYYYKNLGKDIRQESEYKIVSTLGILTNLLDLSLLSVNSIDFVKNNGIEFEEITEVKENPEITLNSLCYIKKIYRRDEKR